jgi:hypothetical protein
VCICECVCVCVCVKHACLHTFSNAIFKCQQTFGSTVLHTKWMIKCSSLTPFLSVVARHTCAGDVWRKTTFWRSFLSQIKRLAESDFHPLWTLASFVNTCTHPVRTQLLRHSRAPPKPLRECGCWWRGRCCSLHANHRRGRAQASERCAWWMSWSQFIISSGLYLLTNALWSNGPTEGGAMTSGTRARQDRDTRHKRQEIQEVREPRYNNKWYLWRRNWHIGFFFLGRLVQPG